MKILQIGKFGKETPGGIETTVFTLSEYLSRTEEVDVVVNSVRRPTRIIEDKKLRIHEVKAWSALLSTPVSPRLMSYLKRFKDTDIVQISLPNPMAAAAYLWAKPCRKLVLWYHSDVIRQDRWAGWYYVLQRKLFEQAAVIVCSSETYRDSSIQLASFREKVRVIPYGIRISDFDGVNSKETQKIRDRIGGSFVLFIGRLVYYKGVEYLIRAMKDIEVPLVLVGRGASKSHLERLAVKLGVQEKVHFLDVPAGQSLAPYLHAADLLVLPSIVRAEAFGMVLLEAMACRKPVVTTRIGTATDFVCQDGVTGYCVPPSDPDALKSAIQKILNDPELARRMGEAGRERVERIFSVEGMTRAFLKLYEDILKV